jgi:hypothetical protein
MVPAGTRWLTVEMSASSPDFDEPGLETSREAPGVPELEGVARHVWLVVAEGGTSSEMLAAVPEAGGLPELVVAQTQGERPMDFAVRVIRHILSIERDHRQVSGTVMHFGPNSTAEIAAARHLVARALITHAVSLGADLGDVTTAAIELPQMGV